MKIIAIVILIAVLVGGAIMFFGGNRNSSSDAENNITFVDGKQIIIINAKGGYFPKVTMAKADLPTVIKIQTQGTFDCSSSLRIPSLGYRNNLPPSGETLVNVLPQKAGTTIRGLCVMGMYNFAINFN